MLQTCKQYKDTIKLLRELLFERKLLERQISIRRPRRKIDEQRLEELKIEILEHESKIEFYNALRDGLTDLDFGGIHQAGKTLIMGRIAAGLTQAQLAELSGVNPKLLIRYEQSVYQNASLKRIRKVAETLELAIAKRF
jgi:Helix-turn-helix.